MDGIILERHDGSPQAAAGSDLVSGLELIEHGLPFLLAALLRHDQEKVKDGEDEDEGSNTDPTHTAATDLQSQDILHARLRSERMNPRKNARAYQRRGRCYFTTGFGSTSAGFVGLGLNPGRSSR
jgi:hypothetical protein